MKTKTAPEGATKLPTKPSHRLHVILGPSAEDLQSSHQIRRLQILGTGLSVTDMRVSDVVGKFALPEAAASGRGSKCRRYVLRRQKQGPLKPLGRPEAVFQIKPFGLIIERMHHDGAESDRLRRRQN